MARKLPINGRLVAIALLAGIILVALVLATGGSPSATAPTPGHPQPAPTAAATQAPAGEIKGTVVSQVRHLAGHTWRFRYVVRNTGSLPIAGFEISSPRANLWSISGRRGWTFYGSGVCGQTHPGVLIYWSTGASSPTVIQPSHSAQFAFTVNTGRVAPVTFSLSWGPARPLFGQTSGPAASALAPSVACR